MQLKARTDEFRKELADGKTLDDHPGPGLRHRARGGQAHARPAPFRRAADRRHGAARGRHRRDEDRRRQDAGRDARGLSQRARRQGRPRRHRQRLPRPPRRRLDGPDLQLPRSLRRRDRARPRRFRAQARLRLRHHLRHQQRIRLRLSARQHEVPAGGHGPARPLLRHRRRSGLDPDRRGAHAADHLRSARRPLGFLQHHRHLLPAARQERLRRRREAAHGDPDRSRHGEARESAARRRPAQGRVALRRRERLRRPSRQPGAARAHAVHPRQGLHRPRRRGRDHRRVHRPHDAGPALFGRPAPGAGSQGASAGAAGEPDARLDHLPELFPDVREARRHDRHGGDRSRRVVRHLQARGRGDPDQRAGRASRRGRRGLSHPGREIRRDPRRDRARQQPLPAGAGRHRLDREVRGAGRVSEEERLQADRIRQRKRDGQALCRRARRQAVKTLCRAERALPRAGSLYRRRGRRARRDHDRDQHGRPRHRHQARRLARHAHRSRRPPASKTKPRRPRRSSGSRPTSSVSATSC